MSSGVQTLRFRKPTTAGDKENPKPKVTKHSGILQDQLRRSAKAPWCPSFSVAIRIIFLLRFSAAIYSTIQDCDEVYNFWEPLHYLQHGVGFQTWELSPEFAIRSWAYIILHLTPLQFVSRVFKWDKRAQFFTLRCIFALVTTLCEAKLYRSVVEHVQIRVGRYMFFIMLFNAGMWGASTAFLPSTFAMYTTTLASAYAFQLPSISRPRRTLTATVLFALGALVGWPFAIAVAIPFVFEEIFLLGADRVNPQDRPQWAVKRFTRLVGCGLAAALILIPCILVDSYAYGQFTIAPWTIVRYNVFGGTERGPDLYGTSPWHFYFQNLILNFNVTSVVALLSLPALGITYLFDRRRLGLRAQANETSPFSGLAVRLAPFYVWMTILTAQPHKEERFMYPVYPLICFNAGTTLYLVRGWIEVVYIKSTNSPYKASRSSIFSTFTLGVILSSTLLSISRIFAVTRYYHAPLSVASQFGAYELPRLLNVTGFLPYFPPTDGSPRVDLTPVKEFNLTLCLGKDWYRFPSHYLIPSGINVEFIKSNFDGHLPRHFEHAEGVSLLNKVEGTRHVPKDLNDLNREEPLHYVDISTCDYLFDTDYPDRPTSTESIHEPVYANDAKSWDRAICKPLLDASNTPTLVRMLWLPGQGWKRRASWGNLCLLRNKKLASKRESRLWAGQK